MVFSREMLQTCWSLTQFVVWHITDFWGTRSARQEESHRPWDFQTHFLHSHSTTSMILFPLLTWGGHQIYRISKILIKLGFLIALRYLIIISEVEFFLTNHPTHFLKSSHRMLEKTQRLHSFQDLLLFEIWLVSQSFLQR